MPKIPHTEPIPISQISPIPNRYSYRVRTYIWRLLYTDTDTATESYLFILYRYRYRVSVSGIGTGYRYRVSVPGIGTWYRYWYRSNSKPDAFLLPHPLETSSFHLKSYFFELRSQLNAQKSNQKFNSALHSDYLKR